jgi:hypothetical protein
MHSLALVAASPVPIVTTPTAANVTSTTATLGATVISEGGAAITGRGVVYAPTATNPNPQIGGTGVGNLTTTGTTGAFTVNITNLTPGMAYTFVAYATNSVGTSYSSTGSFTTPPSSGLATWRQTWYGANANAGNAADNADPYNTGVQNLAVFAFYGPNQAPSTARISDLPQPQLNGGNLSYSFAEPAGISGITYGAEWSLTLETGSWQAIPDSGTPPQHIFSVPLGANDKLFMRLRVSNP